MGCRLSSATGDPANGGHEAASGREKPVDGLPFVLQDWPPTAPKSPFAGIRQSRRGGLVTMRHA